MIEQEKIKKVLFYQPWGMGDMVMFTPVMLNIRRYYPNAQIHLACRPSGKILMANCPWIEKFIDLAPPDKRTLFTMLNVIRQIRNEKYDLVFAAAPVTSHYMGRLFVKISGAKYTVANSACGFPWSKFTFSSPVNRKIHTVEQNIELLKAFLGNNSRINVEFYKPNTAKDDIAADEILKKHGFSGRKILGVHAGCDAANKYRRWPAANFNQLLTQFLSENTDACVLGFAGPGEEDIIEAYPKDKFPDRVAVIQNKLGVVASLLQKCSLVLTTDSGLGHIAISMSTPTAAIFGPGNWRETAPYGKNGHVIKLEPALDCMPCVPEYKTCYMADNYCLKNLTVEYVKTTLKKIWNEYKK